MNSIKENVINYVKGALLTVLNIVCCLPFVLCLTAYDKIGGKISKDQHGYIFWYSEYPLGRITYNQAYSYFIQLKLISRFLFFTVKYKFFTKPEKYDDEE